MRTGHYERKLETKAGLVALKMPKVRRLPFERRSFGCSKKTVQYDDYCLQAKIMTCDAPR
jgi:hypothetical protein